MKEFVAQGGTIFSQCGIDSSSYRVRQLITGGYCAVVTRIFEFTDSCGIPFTCSQVLEIRDRIAPVIVCHEINLDAGDPIPAPYTSAQAFVNDGGFLSDNCALDLSSWKLVSNQSTMTGNPPSQKVIRTYSIADSCGNISMCSQTISVAAFKVTAVVQDVICMGENSGKISLTVLGGTGPYTFNWTNANGYTSIQKDISGLSAGSYTVEVTDTPGNKVTTSFVVRPGATPVTPFFAPIGPYCYNEPVLPLPTVSTNGIRGRWNPAVVDNSKSLDYTFTPDPEQRALPVTITITIDLANVPVLAVVHPLCTGQKGTITVISPVGSQYDYAIDGLTFRASPVFAGLDPGVYTVTVRNAAGCTRAVKDTVDDIPMIPMLRCFNDTTVTCIDDIPRPYETFEELMQATGTTFKPAWYDLSTFSYQVTANMTIKPARVVQNYSITNMCGYTATCQRVITIEDLVPPILICPSPASVNCLSDLPNSTTLAGFIAAGGDTADNCRIDPAPSG